MQPQAKRLLRVVRQQQSGLQQLPRLTRQHRRRAATSPWPAPAVSSLAAVPAMALPAPGSAVLRSKHQEQATNPAGTLLMAGGRVAAVEAAVGLAKVSEPLLRSSGVSNRQPRELC